jgi:transcriptional regulator with XRE-family HTH domain
MDMTSADDSSESRKRFGLLLRELRQARGMSLSGLANMIHFNRSYISNVEAGKRLPEKVFADLADRELRAAGKLFSCWKIADDARRSHGKIRQMLISATQESEFLSALDADDIDSEPVGGTIGWLAVSYLNTPPAPMLAEAARLRSAVVRALKSRDKPGELERDYLIAAGRLSGVLAYAALDLGVVRDARLHANAAFRCAERADDNELRAWTRGTQSLIARFDNDYRVALDLAREGYENYSGRGTSAPRLLCGVAQSLANLGDSKGANEALAQAADSREKMRTADSLSGLFGFSEAKQHYYAGSSLIWLDGPENARRAAYEASKAIEIWQKSPMPERSLDDEALAHIYWATALVKLDEIDEAGVVLRPIFDLPPERRISWIAKRMRRISDMLTDHRYSRSPLANNLREEILAYDVGGGTE